MNDSGASFGGKGEPNGGKRFVGAGGTPGGVGEFFLGLLLGAAGVYMLFNRVTVHTSFWRFGGLSNSFGVSLVPLLVGVVVLFANGRSTIGWLLTVGGFLFIVAGILMNMDIYFERTSLWNTLVMLVMMASGLGLVLRSLRPQPARAPKQP